MSRPVVCLSRSPEDTRAIAAIVAASLVPGDIVVLSGDLGAGKTCFVQGAATALGVDSRVTSPSFVLVREYEGRVPVRHLDVYRLSRMQEFLDLGYEEILDPVAVVFIEWGDAVEPLLPDQHMEVEIRRLENSTRRIAIAPTGARLTSAVAEASARLASWLEEQEA